MFDSHDRVLEKLAASGGKEFSLETLKAVMDEVWQEGAARHEQEVMQSAEPVTWAQASEGLEPIPQREQSAELER